ncbi:hypothetical protein BOX15_Mlig011768g1, partial [Macrostomum lignano]
PNLFQFDAAPKKERIAGKTESTFNKYQTDINATQIWNFFACQKYADASA